MSAGFEVGAYVAAALAVLLTPGPAVAFVVARSVERGRHAGIVSQLGLCTGLLVHVAASVLGLSIVLTRSAHAIGVLKLVGAGYLVCLGIQTIVSSDSNLPTEANSAEDSNGRLFLDGFLIDVLNPKPALFFLAFLPQFVDPRVADPRPQLAVLGLLFVVLALLTGSAWAVLGASVSRRLRASETLRKRTRQATGATYLGLGVVGALWSVRR
ncbi:MAG: LysE family translocator [Thermoanaerobaculia bacterium]|nr:LysE family translocator [Thermoanaerobaculia bacterium]